MRTTICSTIGPGMAALLALASCGKSSAPPPSSGAPSNQVETQANAADLYRAAWAQVGNELSLAAGAVQFGSQGATVQPGEGPSWEQVAELLRQNQAIVGELVAAAGTDHCAFNFPRITGETTGAEAGPVMELLGNLRTTGRLLRADAARCWMEGDTEGAVDRMVALVGHCRQVSQEPVVIVALANVAVLTLGAETARTMAEGAAGRTLSEDQRARLLAALDRLDARDPAGLSLARRTEGKTGDARADAGIERARQRAASEVAEAKRALGGR